MRLRLERIGRAQAFTRRVILAIGLFLTVVKNPPSVSEAARGVQMENAATVLRWAGRGFGPAAALHDDGGWDFKLQASA